MGLHAAWAAAPLLLLLAGLGLHVSGLRVRGVWRRDEARFTRWQRAHGNAVEHVPFAVLVLFLYELAGGPPWAVLALGATLVGARVLHAWGTGGRVRRAKFAGAALTYGVEVVLGALLLVELLLGL
jgi:uncharacterized membrane protein YecN with MAPEG domain